MNRLRLSSLRTADWTAAQFRHDPVWPGLDGNRCGGGGGRVVGAARQFHKSCCHEVFDGWFPIRFEGPELGDRAAVDGYHYPLAATGSAHDGSDLVS